MKKALFILTMILLPAFLKGQTYSNLWKQVKDAEQQDLPQTEQKLLRQIAQKASTERNYGQLLKAQLQEARAMTSISRDSLLPAVSQLQQQEQQAAGDEVLQAVYDAVLGFIFQNTNIDTDDLVLDGLDHIKDANERRQFVARHYYDKALSHPDKLAAVKATDYEPFVVKGADSRLFGDDLLSVIGYEAGRFDVLRDYYVKAGNRRAALLSTLEVLRREAPEGLEPLNKSQHLQRLDSLIKTYADLTECGEAAIARYEFMDGHTDATDEQRWQYINYALDRWGGWQRMNVLRNSQHDLTALTFNAEFDKLNIPERQQEVKLRTLRGINSLTMRIYSVKTDGNTYLNPSSTEDYRKLKPLLTPLPHMTQTRTFVGHQPYETFNDSMAIGALPPGVYLVEFESAPQTDVSRRLYYVSDVRVMVQPMPGKQQRYVVVNATTGQPLKGASVRLSKRVNYNDRRTLTVLTTNADGEATYHDANDDVSEVFAYTTADAACPYLYSRGDYHYNGPRELISHTELYTDRQIYRPGQTVRVAAICYQTRHGYQNEVEGGKRVNMMLRDANHQVIAEKELVTDDYGTCTADFTLPVQTLNGHFTVSCNGHSTSFRVEEYKRPAFEVDIPAVSRTYDDGDTLVVRGTARTYAGVPVQGAHVKYKVERRKAFWWFSYSRYWDSGVLGTGSDDELLFSGEATTDADGSFAMDVPIVVPKTLYTMFYNFVVTADVTDQGGETHQGILSLPMGNRRTAFTSTIPERVLAEEDTKMSFHQQNAAGVDLEATVRYRFDDGKWQEVKTNTLFTIPSLKSGRHTLEAICEQDSLKEKFIVFSLDDRQPAYETDDWFYASNTQFPNNRQPVTVQVGSSAKDVHIVYSIFAGDNIVESGYVDRSNELLNRKFAYQENYGDGILLTFAWVKEGKTYQHRTTIRRPLPDKHLKLTWHTFRNRLTPGQQEEWTLTVQPPATTESASGNAAYPVAQLMATLYDKSLDQLSAHSWGLYPYVSLPLPSTSWSIVSEGLAYCSGYKHQGVLNVNGLALSTFDHSVYPSNYYGRFDLIGVIGGSGGIRVRGTRMMKAASNVAFDEVVEEQNAILREVVPTADAAQSKAVAAEIADGLADEAAPGEESHEQPVQVRENLQETAFFYPQLTTDKDGNVALRFTLPESLTTWRFMTIAHTKDMMYGSFADEAVARKDVMIQPNMPRFLRQGDRATISARIINTSEKALSGNARLLLIDPETDKTVAQSTLPVTLSADSTVSVSFACQPQEDWPSLLIAKVTISGTDFSDGEQHYLPILANQEQVTVTVPFTQHGPGTKEVNIETILPKAQAANSKPQITVEYTNNPAWLMVQALPAIGHPHDNCAICQAASLYANTIGSHIIAQNPQAKTVFEQWKQEELNAAAEHASFSTLNSQLEKNQELKDLLLNETPWVIDANNEREQRHRLADFFDENLMQQRLSTAVSQLENLQLSDGAWSWWPGMPGSWYITVEVSEMLVRLNQMTGKQYPKLLDPAFKYIGKEIVKLVDEMKKEEKLGHKQSFPSFKCLQWLYICTLDGRELPANVRDANAYLTALLKKETKSQTIYEKALSAIVLNNQTYIKSLKEFTVYKEEMGRYYDTQRASYSWRDYRIPTQVAAIEAIKRLTPNDTTTIEQMQRWLLQEKRTQAWDTPINSADAVYAFLNGNTETLKAQPKSVLRIDGKELDTPTATAGIGYVKTTLPLAATGKDAPKVFTAEKTSTGTSWGAVYAQFMQNTIDITDQASGLTVKREVFLSTQNTQSNLKVGDRVTVRLTITADRDYDFVQVIDKRAACLEPVNQLSGYHWGYYCSPKDYTTNFYFDRMSKGKHVIENEYYVDREGTYTTGTCTVGCAYAPEYRGMTHAQTFEVVAND